MAKLLKAFAPYRKTAATAAGTTLTWYITAAPDGISRVELAGLALVLGTTLGVFHVTNTPS